MYPLEENISVARVTRGFLGCGGLYFAEKVGLNEFVIIFRDLKGARIACGVRAIDHHPVEVCCKLTQKKNNNQPPELFPVAVRTRMSQSCLSA